MPDVISNCVIMAFYSGTNGPTIRIAIHNLECLEQVRDVFMSLAEGQLHSAELTDAVRANVSGMKSLQLQLTSKERMFSKALHIVEHQQGSAEFVWMLSALGWRECAELVDGIIEGNRPGHQYFTTEGVDDAIVVISYKEQITPSSGSICQSRGF